MLPQVPCAEDDRLFSDRQHPIVVGNFVIPMKKYVNVLIRYSRERNDIP